MDANHKLIRWTFVVHGAIDGFSRTIIYLSCSTDNKSQTVFQLFLDSLPTFKCPRRIRSDHGTENIDVARWMLNHIGQSAKPFLACPCTTSGSKAYGKMLICMLQVTSATYSIT